MEYIDINQVIQKKEHTMHRLHSHAYYEIYCLTKGSRMLFLTDKFYELDSMSLIIIPPFVMHKTDGGPFERFNINVTEKQMNEFQLSVIEKKKLIPLKPNESIAKEMLDALNKTLNIENSDKPYISSTVFSYFVLLLNQVSMESEIETKNRNIIDKMASPTISSIITYLNDNYYKEISLDELSTKFFISKSTLINNFKKVTNCTPIEFVIKKRISVAKKMLLETKKTINQISSECGFSSSNYFGIIFKKFEYISPQQYRNKNR